VAKDFLLRNEVFAHFTIIDPEIPLWGEIEEESPDTFSRLLQPSRRAAVICEDKYAFFLAAKSSGIPVLETYLSAPAFFPYIRKDRRGSAASGFRVYRTPADEMAEESIGSGDFIYQPFCGGSHFCVDAYYSLDAGNLVDFCVKEVLVKSNGESYLLRSCPRDGFGEILRMAGELLPLKGIVNFDILDDSGTLKVLEINCRIGGNYPASHRFGCNLLERCFDELFSSLDQQKPVAPYPTDRVIAKYFAFTAPLELSALTPVMNAMPPVKVDGCKGASDSRLLAVYP
jgi:hypothetical protein